MWKACHDSSDTLRHRRDRDETVAVNYRKERRIGICCRHLFSVTDVNCLGIGHG
jgi:hypothetical protein